MVCKFGGSSVNNSKNLRYGSKIQKRQLVFLQYYMKVVFLLHTSNPWLFLLFKGDFGSTMFIQLADALTRESTYNVTIGGGHC